MTYGRMPNRGTTLSSFDEDVVITKETYKGKELVRVDDEKKAQDPPYVRQGHFRLMDLPAELRVSIYGYLLPYNMDISFKLKPSDSYLAQYSATRHLAVSDPPEWLVNIASKQPQPPSPSTKMDARRSIIDGVFGPRRPWTQNQLQTQLLLVSKAVSTEAKAVLYGSNTYHFTVSSNAHHPVSLRSPQIFGPFGQEEHLPLLRNLRSMCIEVLLNDSTHWSVKRQRARLEYFIEILKQHSDDDNRKSLLQELKVNMSEVLRRSWLSRCSRHPAQETDVEKFMFGLESLVELQGIKDVEITGVPDWYARCLQLCVQGKGGEVGETGWPLVQAKKGKAWSKKWVSTRQWYQPMLNWKEFAERNGVELPEDIDKYWMDEA